MNAVRLIPVYLCALLLGAHFYRSYDYVLLGISLLLPFILFIRKVWAARATQIFLLLGAAEWIRTTIMLADIRQQEGMPWTRLVVILGSVALFTALSAFLFQLKSLKKRYGMK
jgi:hypothetical protein